MQLQIFGHEVAKWVTYVSDVDDGINWQLIDDGYKVKIGCEYPLSIGVNSTNNPQWGIGQFPDEYGRIYLAFLKII